MEIDLDQEYLTVLRKFVVYICEGKKPNATLEHDQVVQQILVQRFELKTTTF